MRSFLRCTAILGGDTWTEQDGSMIRMAQIPELELMVSLLFLSPPERTKTLLRKFKEKMPISVYGALTLIDKKLEGRHSVYLIEVFDLLHPIEPE